MYKAEEDDWWNETDSSSDSSYPSSCSNESLSPDWEDQVNAQGELFYVTRYPKVSKATNDGLLYSNQDNKDNKPEKSSSGLLVKLIRRKSSHRKNEGDNPPSYSKSKWMRGEFYHLNVRVMPEYCSQDGSLLEKRIGLSVEANKSKLIVKGFTPNQAHLFQGVITLGDILYSIDNYVVNGNNIDEFLRTTAVGKEVVLKFKSAKARKVSSSVLAKKGSLKLDSNFHGWVMYTRPSELKEGSPVEEAVVYSFPSLDKTFNPLTMGAGGFFTLLHLLPSLTMNLPVSSSICVGENLLNVMYTTEGKDVFLLCLPEERVPLKEAKSLNQNLIRCLKFTYQSLSRCFSKESNKARLSEIFGLFFQRISQKKYVGNSVEREFESILPACSFLPLPKEIQVQLGDALNELEANDIKEYENHRLYSVIGSCYFHRGYLIRWHMNKEDLVDISCHARTIGLLDLCNDGVKDLVSWREVYPASTQRGLSLFPNQPYTLPNGRWFLMVVAQKHDMLLVLLESGGCTARMEGNPGPNAIYVDEAQATLEHIQSLGISKFISRWLDFHLSYGVVLESNKNSAEIFTSSSLNHDSSRTRVIEGAPTLSRTHRTSMEHSSASGWEEGRRGRSLSLPNVLGKRAERERSTETRSHSRIGNSTLSQETNYNGHKWSDSNSLFDMSEFSKNLPQDIKNLPLSRLGLPTGGVFHYIQLDNNEGVLVSNLQTGEHQTVSNNFKFVINSFRKYANHIHNILSNTVSFKKIKVHDIGSVNINKSLVAVKEHGILFQSYRDEAKKTLVSTYWVIGRLFFTPQLKEVYVCYEDTCPQNMIEIAFRIALNCYI